MRILMIIILIMICGCDANYYSAKAEADILTIENSLPDQILKTIFAADSFVRGDMNVGIKFNICDMPITDEFKLTKTDLVSLKDSKKIPIVISLCEGGLCNYGYRLYYGNKMLLNKSIDSAVKRQLIPCMDKVNNEKEDEPIIEISVERKSDKKENKREFNEWEGY